MHLRLLTTAIPALLALFSLAACNQAPQPPQTVTIDMDLVSEAIHLDTRVNTFRKALNEELQAGQNALRAQYRKEFEDTQAGFGEEPTQEQQDQLKRMGSRLQQQLMRAQMENNQRKNRETDAFREAILDNINPIIQDVAGSHGASIVLDDVPVVWSATSLDITAEVISRLPGEETRDPATEASGDTAETPDAADPGQ